MLSRSMGCGDDGRTDAARGSTMAQTMLAKAIRASEKTLTEIADLIAAHSEGRLVPTVSQLSDWQNARIRPSDHYIKAFAAVLEVDERALRDDLDKHATKRRKQRSMEETLTP